MASSRTASLARLGALLVLPLFAQSCLQPDEPAAGANSAEGAVRIDPQVAELAERLDADRVQPVLAPAERGRPGPPVGEAWRPQTRAPLSAPLTFVPPPTTFTVNTVSDTLDATPGNGVCADSAGECSLRAAVMEANANAGVDTITVPAGTYRLTRAGANENGALTGDLDILEGVTLVGAGASQTLIEAGTNSSDGIDKIFSVNPLFTSAFVTSLSGMTLRHGKNPSAFSGDGFGGALDWEGSGTGVLTLTDLVIERNATTDGDGGGLALTSNPPGGRVFLQNVRVIDNEARRIPASNAPLGGGIFVGSGTALEMAGGEIAGNRAANVFDGTRGQGGGVYLFGPSAPSGSRFTDTVFFRNEAGIGGAVHTGQGLQFLGQPRFEENHARNGTGGALFHNTSNEATVLSHAVFIGNTASADAGGTPSGAAIQVGNSTTGNLLTVHFSRFARNTIPTSEGLVGSGLHSTGGTVNAENNWWSCSDDPAAAHCNRVSGANVDFTPWLRLTATASADTLQLDDVATVTASVRTNSSNEEIALSDLVTLIGQPLLFVGINGALTDADPNLQADGTARVTFRASGAGAGGVDVFLDEGPTRAAITVLAPNLVVDKSHSGDFRQGQAGRTYALEVTNVGAGRTGQGATVWVVDALPAGLVATAFAGEGWRCDLPSLTCDRTEVLAAGARFPVIALTVDVAPDAAPLVENVATVGGGGQLDTSDDRDADLTVVTQVADLVLQKSHAGNFYLGRPGTYSLVVSNTGPGPTLGTVTVTDTLPPSLTATALSGAGWSCSLAPLRCERTDELASGAAWPPLTLTVSVAPDAPASVTNVAQVAGGGELNTSNNGATDPANVLQVPDLTLTKTHFGAFRQGQLGAVYSLVVTNSGSQDSAGTISVTDVLPAGLSASAMSGDGWSCELGTLSCSRADALAPSASFPAITLSVDVAADAPAFLTNVASVQGGGEDDSSNNSASDLTQIYGPADVVVAKSHPGDFHQGQVGARYTLRVSNVGSGPTVGEVSVSDTLPPSLTATALSGQGWSCELAALRCTRSDALEVNAAYPDLTLTVDVATDAPAAVINVASVSGGGQENTANDGAEDPTTIHPPADLVIAKSHAGDFTQRQQGATYLLVISNSGAGPTQGEVSVSDQLPAGLTATGMGGEGWTCDLAAVGCVRSDRLAPGGSYPAITVTVAVNADAPATVLNVARVFGGGDSNVDNNEATDQTVIVQLPDLRLAKRHEGELVAGMKGAQYRLTVSNAGMGATRGELQITDDLPSGLQATALEGEGWECDLATLGCRRSDVLAPGASHPEVVLTVDVGETPGEANNTATVSGGGEDLATAADNTVTDPGEIVPAPAGCGCGSTPGGANGFFAALCLALLWRVRRRGLSVER